MCAHHNTSRIVLVFVALAFGSACAITPRAPRRGEALPPEPGHEQSLPVKPADEPVAVAAWAEPRYLPAGGGEAQIVIRVQKRGGARFPGVEVRLSTSRGSLFSDGRILVTDAQGMTRDRLRTQTTATITLNAGGTRYRFQVPVGEEIP